MRRASIWHRDVTTKGYNKAHITISFQTRTFTKLHNAGTTLHSLYLLPLSRFCIIDFVFSWFRAFALSWFRVFAFSRFRVFAFSRFRIFAFSCSHPSCLCYLLGCVMLCHAVCAVRGSILVYVSPFLFDLFSFICSVNFHTYIVLATAWKNTS